MEWGIKIKTEKHLLLAKIESQGPIATLSPNPLKPRPDPGENSFQYNEAQWSQEMGPDHPSSPPCVQVTVQGADPGGAQRTPEWTRRSWRSREAQWLELTGGGGRGEGTARSTGQHPDAGRQPRGPCPVVISPRMSTAPEPPHKAKKKKTRPRRIRQFLSHFCVSQDEAQEYLWNSELSSTNRVKVTAGKQSKIAKACGPAEWLS